MTYTFVWQHDPIGKQKCNQISMIIHSISEEIIHTNGNADNRIYNHGVKFTGLKSKYHQFIQMVGENFELY